MAVRNSGGKFMNLAKQITDRPIYALRARGFDGEPFFGSMDEMVSTYLGR